jgi:hypothetical protein
MGYRPLPQPRTAASTPEWLERRRLAREVRREVNHDNIFESELDEWRKMIETLKKIWRVPSA